MGGGTSAVTSNHEEHAMATDLQARDERRKVEVDATAAIGDSLNRIVDRGWDVRVARVKVRCDLLPWTRALPEEVDVDIFHLRGPCPPAHKRTWRSPIEDPPWRRMHLVPDAVAAGVTRASTAHRETRA